MAKGGRPSKYHWDKIRAEYEMGKSKAYLHKEYDIPYSSLSTKIKRDGWEVANNEISEKAKREMKEKLLSLSDRFTYEELLETIESLISGIKYIYILRLGNLQYYKIGVSSDIDTRVKQLQAGSPEELIRIYSKEFATPYKLETYLHKKYKDYNTHGEWFKFKTSEVDEVINYIESIKGFFNG